MKGFSFCFDSLIFAGWLECKFVCANSRGTLYSEIVVKTGWKNRVCRFRCFVAVNRKYGADRKKQIHDNLQKRARKAQRTGGLILAVLLSLLSACSNQWTQQPDVFDAHGVHLVSHERGTCRLCDLYHEVKGYVVRILRRSESSRPRVSWSPEAKILGLKPTTLEARMKKLGIKRKG